MMQISKLHVLLLVPLLVLWVFLRSIYRDRVGAFGCFDDCFNYVAGYFIGSGKKLYSEIFFNHQPLMAYLSAVVQYLNKPDSIYLLIYRHRMFMIYASLAANVFLTLRFGLVGFAFSLLYETTKGFIFGDRFLAESLIVYPLVYLVGLEWLSRGNKKVYRMEFLVAAAASWFVVFAREPYVPLALFLLAVLLWRNRNHAWAKAALLLFLALSTASIARFRIADYWYNVVTVNRQVVAASEIGGQNLFGEGLITVFFYPLFLLFGSGEWNLFHTIEAGLSVIFLIVLWYRGTNRRWSSVLLSVFVLGLANIRPGVPGKLYYAQFHHIQWYALLIAVVLFELSHLWQEKRKVLASGLSACFVGIAVYAIASHQSYLWERVDRQTEFTTNYGHVHVIGDVIKTLSNPGDTLFLDEWDDLIYWQAQRLSPYRFSWYTSFMPQIARYREARLEMFQNNPPDFYYGKCQGDSNDQQSLPTDEVGNYVRLTSSGKPTCVYVKKSKLVSISDAQWQTVNDLYRYTVPADVR